MKFLSQEWAEQITTALNSSAEFNEVASGQELRLQQVVIDSEQGEVEHYFLLEDGRALVSIGSLDDPEATITQDYETAAAMSRGELGAQQAFMQGKLKVTGQVMKLLQLQGVFGALRRAVEGIPVDY